MQSFTARRKVSLLAAFLVIIICSAVNFQLRYDGRRYIRRIDDASFGWPATHYRGNLHHKTNVEFNIIVLVSNILFAASLAGLAAAVMSILVSRKWALRTLLGIVFLAALLLSSWRVGQICEVTGEPVPDPETPVSQ